MTLSREDEVEYGRESSLHDGNILGMGISDGRLHRMFVAFQRALDEHAIVALTDRAGRIEFVNEKFRQISGYSSNELVGHTHRIVNSGYHPPGFFADMWRCIAGGQVWRGEVCNRAKSGALYWVDTTVVPIMDDRGRAEAYVSIRYDITWRKAFERALQDEVQLRRQAEDLLRDVIQTVPDGIAAFDVEDRLIVYNDAYADYLGASEDVVKLGTTYEAILRYGLENGRFVLPRNSREARESWLQSKLKEHRGSGRKTVQAMSDGRWFQVHERRSASGHTVGTRTDITELKRSEAAIKYHSEHDPLTGLHNRSVLQPRLSQAIAGSVRSGTRGAVILFDLDKFKAVNDSLGHAAGDYLLESVARRLESVLRKSDTAIRLGGDEFAIILSQVSPDAVGNVCERLLTAVRQPLVYHGSVIKPGLSIGAAIFPRDGRTVEDLLKRADLALYHSKNNGDSKYCLYSHGLHSREESRRELATALAAAIAAGDIGIALQPQFDICSLAHTGFEALARWSHGGAPVSPAQFIPIAEAGSLAVPLGARVIERVADELRQLKNFGFPVGKTAVNLSEAQLVAPDFPASLCQSLHAVGLAPNDIELELTENMLLDRGGDLVDRNLRELRDLGFSIALDDFGTGHSSLSHLTRYAIDKIKIDRGFVAQLPEDQASVAIVRAVIRLAHDLGMTVVAEGVESERQLSLLRDLECDFGQGFLVSPPLTPGQVAGYLAGTGGNAVPRDKQDVGRKPPLPSMPAQLRGLVSKARSGVGRACRVSVKSVVRRRLGWRPVHCGES